jgi:hypothetical protein
MQGSAAFGATGGAGAPGGPSGQPGPGGAPSGGGPSVGSAGPTAPAALARTIGPGDGRRRRNRRLAVGAGVTAAVLLLVGGGVARRASSDRADEVVAEVPPATDEVAEEVLPAAPAPDAASTAGADEPLGASTTTTAQPTTTTVPAPPVVEELTLRPATDRPPTYPMAEAPVLSWDVSGADRVEVWMWTDTGSGPQRTKVLAGQPSGSMAICPGTVAAGRCSAVAATYLFVVEAENEGGRVVSSDTAPAPRLVVATVIG